MRNFSIILVTALVSAAVAVGAYRFIDNRRNATYFPEESQKARFVSTRSDVNSSSAGNPDFVQAANSVTPAVVHIKTTYTRSSGGNPLEEFFGGGGPRQARGSGSGVIISPDGYIVTNNHVVEDASRIEIVLPDRRTFTGKIIGTDPNTDLAVVKVNGNNLPVVEMGNSDVVQTGEWVLAVGYPFSLNTTVTAGIISAKGRSIGILDQPTRGNAQGASTAIESFLQTDAAINPGNSGGALVNASGQLIGINAAIASQTGSYAGYGFAIPVNLARKVINDFIKFGEVRRGYLGVSFPAPAAEEQLLKQQGINPGSVQGVFITGVQPGSAAAEAGLKEGDIIQSIDGNKVVSSAEFSERIARHRPGDKVALSYLRGKNTNNVTVTLKGRENAVAANPGSADGRQLQERLGASFAPLSAAAKQRYRLSSGIVVTDVTEGGFFDQAGIPRGTIITSVNGRPVNSVEGLNNSVGSARNGMVRIDGITPDGSRFVFNFPLGA